MSLKVLIIEGLLGPMLYLLKKGLCTLLDEKLLGKLIPQFQNLTLQAKQKQLNKWLDNEAKVVCRVKPNQYLPNAKKKKSTKALRSGTLAFLAGTNVFETFSFGYTLLAHILCGLHMSALQEVELGFHSVLSLNSRFLEIKELLSSIVQAVVTRRHWSGKRYEIKRKAVLDYSEGAACGFSAHIQDFSHIKVKYKKYHAKTAFPYRDTFLLVIGANSAQIREASPYIEHAAVTLLNSSSGDLNPTKFSSSSISAYDPIILERFQTDAPCIAATLRWWWKLFDNEDAWARKIVQEARDSFGQPDSRYVRVEIDPRKLRDAIHYRVFLSFLDEVETAGLMSPEELIPYRQKAKDVFDPAPPEPVQLRHAEDPEVFLEIMKTLVENPPAPIVAEGGRFVKKDKPLAAWRNIGGNLYLVFLEETWAQAYAKAVRARSKIDRSFFQREHWKQDLQKLLCEHDLIKAASSGYRYRYDLLQNGTRDSTYVVAVPAHLLIE